MGDIFPKQYDLREQNLISPVKDQKNIGDCWAFATLAALESVAKKQFGTEYDFSEINMAVNNGITTPNAGGNDYISAHYLTSWKGPVFETDDPNPNTIQEIKSNAAARPQFHVQQVLFLPDTKGPDHFEIKRALQKYGAVTASIFFLKQYYSKDNASFYNNEVNGVNHEITIVGWNDDYPKEKFQQVAPGNGAFIAKNSYGTSFGDQGYFYISYYDKTIGKYNTAFNNLEPIENYNNAHIANRTFQAHSGVDILETNVFNPISTIEKIAATSIFTFKQGMTYEIFLETDYIENDVRNVFDGKCEKIMDIYLEDTGFHTIKFDIPISVNPDKAFAFVFKEKYQDKDKIKLTVNPIDSPQKIFKGMIYTII